MRFTVLGGDLRSVYLVRRLIRDGHQVQCFGLETADIPEACHSTSLTEALWGTQCVILPVPALESSQLRSPFGSQVISAQMLATCLPRKTPIFAGSITDDFAQQCKQHGVYITDLLSNEALAVKNAALTAQCAVQLILQEIPYSLMGQHVLILGAGRIGKLLGLKLRALGAAVTVSSRREEDKAWCAALGLTPVDNTELTHLLPDCRLLINTVPAQLISSEQLALLPEDALLFELASKPGGFHHAQGLHVIGCGGLPGKYAPKSAADAIADTIYYFLER